MKLAFDEKRTGALVDYIIHAMAKGGEGLNASTISGVAEVLAVLVGKPGAVLPLPKLEALFSAMMGVLFGNTSLSVVTMGETVRNKAFQLLGPLSRLLQKDELLVNTLHPLYQSVGWRTEKSDDWNILAEGPGARNFNGYVGLSNMGATCYVNSVMQQLFMIPAFRDPLLSVSLDTGLKAGKEVLPQLQQVFGALGERQVATYRSKGLYDAMDVDVNVQKDASEFLITLFDRLQEPLRKAHLDSLVKDLFEIRTAARITCGTCKVSNEIPATSLLLSVEVKNKRSLLDGLQAFLQPETLRGDNAYYCKNCTAKVSAERQEIVKSLPNVLLVQLKRFEQGYEASNKKLNSYYEFPLELDLKESLMSAQNKKPREGTWGEIYRAYYRYRLRGVVVHMGIMNSGHYYSLIRDTEKEKESSERVPCWVKFNDTSVDPFTISDLEAETFGNKDENKGSSSAVDDLAMLESVTKSKNAYILVYQREVMLTPRVMHCVETEEVVVEDPREVLREIETLREEQKRPQKAVLSPAVAGKLTEERGEFVSQQRSFNADYIKFVTGLVLRCQAKKEEMTKTEEFALRFFFTTALRSTMKDEVYCLTRHIQEWCRSSKKVAQQIANALSVPANLREFILDCPKAQTRRCVCAILKFVCDLESDSTLRYLQSDKGGEIPYSIRLVDAFLQQLDKINKNYCGQFFEFLTHFARLGPAARSYLFPHLLVGVSLETLGLVKGVKWREAAAGTVVKQKETPPSFLEPSKKCYMTIGDSVVEKLFSVQVPYVLSLVLELLEPFTAGVGNEMVPKDFDSLANLVDKLGFKELLRFAGESRAGLDRVAKLVSALCVFKNGCYVEKVLEATSKGVTECETIELPTYFRIFEVLLVSENYALQYVRLLDFHWE